MPVMNQSDTEEEERSEDNSELGDGDLGPVLGQRMTGVQ